MKKKKESKKKKEENASAEEIKPEKTKNLGKPVLKIRKKMDFGNILGLAKKTAKENNMDWPSINHSCMECKQESNSNDLKEALKEYFEIKESE